MTWVVRLTSPDGDVFYGEVIDREGYRYRCKTPEQAEAFKEESDAEASFASFRLMSVLREYLLEAIELEQHSNDTRGGPRLAPPTSKNS